MESAKRKVLNVSDKRNDSFLAHGVLIIGEKTALDDFRTVNDVNQ